MSVSYRPHVLGLVQSVLSSGRMVAVGCASGLDAIVRDICPDAMVFRASSFSKGALVSRSCECVRTVAASGTGCGWVSFPCCACPDDLSPSPVDSLCFCGSGSGSWASAALAAGLGVPLVVFNVPLSGLPARWGEWNQLSHNSWAGGWMLTKPTVKNQLSLF